MYEESNEATQPRHFKSGNFFVVSSFDEDGKPYTTFTEIDEKCNLNFVPSEE